MGLICHKLEKCFLFPEHMKRPGECVQRCYKSSRLLQSNPEKVQLLTESCEIVSIDCK